MRLLLFGKVGSGKSYVGQLLEHEFGIHYHDADDDLPESIKTVVANHQPITDEMREEFADVITRRILDLESRYDHFCIAQALFKNRLRLKIQRAVTDLVLCWVHAPDALIAQRLLKRTGHLASAYYAKLVNPGFEPPDAPCLTIENSGNDNALISQLRRIVG